MERTSRCWLRFTSLSTSAWLRTGLIRSALTVRPHRPCTRLTFCDALTASLTLRRLCSFCHQPQYSIYHSSCHELGGVRRGIMALSLLDRLVRTLQVHGTHTHASGALACQTADGVVRAAWVSGCRSSPPTGYNRGPVSAAGLAMMLFGHGVRIAAFVTAGSNFSHLVETGARWSAPSCLAFYVFD